MHSVQMFPYVLPALFWFFMISIVTLTKGMINLIFNRASCINDMNHFLFLETALRKFPLSEPVNTNNWRYFAYLAVKYLFGGEKYFAYIKLSLISQFAYIASRLYILWVFPCSIHVAQAHLAENLKVVFSSRVFYFTEICV